MVFAPKYRSKVESINKAKKDIERILRQLYDLKKSRNLGSRGVPDHIHLLVSIPPNVNVSQFMGYLKGKSFLMIFDCHAKSEVQIGKSAFLVSRLLCQYSRIKSGM